MVYETLLKKYTPSLSLSTIFFFGLFYVFLANMLSIVVFRSHASMVGILFLVMLLSRFMWSFISYQKKREMELVTGRDVKKEYERIVSVVCSLGLGVVLGYVLLTILLLALQINIESYTQLQTLLVNISIGEYPIYFSIFSKQISLLLITMLFAFLFNRGGLFIICYSAALVGQILGIVFYNTIVYADSLSVLIVHLVILTLYAVVLFSSYFFIGFAATLFTSLFNKKMREKPGVKRLILHSSILILTSMLLLFIATSLEYFLITAISL